MGFSLEPLCHTCFNPTTHLKRQIDVLRDKMGMDVAPK